MSYKNDFDVFVGGKSGVFKGIKIDKKTCITKNIRSLMSIQAEHEVTSMTWADETEKEILLACGSKGDRSVKIYDTESGAFTTSFVCDIGKGNIKGLARYDDAIITAVESGHIKLWRFEGENESSMETGENLERMRQSPVNKNIIATGGKEHKLQLFDLETHKRVFEEKNVRHDWLELKVPLWISDIGFIPRTSRIVTSSRYGHIRLYDHIAQRRPVINLELKDEALTTLAIASREEHIVVGSGKGIMKLVDLRKPGKILNTYKDFVGSVTSVACSKLKPYIVSVGLDRYLRIHHLDTKALLKKMYLTSRLSSMVLRSNFSMDDEDEVKIETKERAAKRSQIEIENDDDLRITDDERNSDVEYDEMFDEMDVIENEENEANLEENNGKQRKTKKTKLRSDKLTKKLTDGSRKRLKGRNTTGKTI
ncbi:WD repeat-containing protein 74-like isoform X1 [Venturia canescens]|uniref:WD repeat-containing protein 74-like isoform X1 n=1 Tax=Venturia canescens TaxID=32260 RepID=UPI001C9BFEED|nr:WD repeat-containing protein 74-like isoform X1 [Venturia canescens]